MKLFWSTSSPFARKVRVLLREKQLADRVEEIECNPFSDPPALRAANPLGKIPTLLLPSGDVRSTTAR
jgi:glutathione S-transferase